MMKPLVTSAWIMSGWIAIVAITTGASVATGASVSTTALLVALDTAAAIVVGLLSGGGPPPTVAEILHAVETKDGRS